MPFLALGAELALEVLFHALVLHDAYFSKLFCEVLEVVPGFLGDAWCEGTPLDLLLLLSLLVLSHSQVFLHLPHHQPVGGACVV